jgi:cytochrome c
MTQHAGEAPAWTYDELDAFIRAPNRHVPGTKMSFAGIRDTNTRVNLIAWLRSQGSGGYAIPAPDPARQPGAAPAAPAEGAPVAPGAAEAAQANGGQAGGAPVSGASPAAQPTTVTSPQGSPDDAKQPQNSLPR